PATTPASRMRARLKPAQGNASRDRRRFWAKHRSGIARPATCSSSAEYRLDRQPLQAGAEIARLIGGGDQRHDLREHIEGEADFRLVVREAKVVLGEIEQAALDGLLHDETPAQQRLAFVAARERQNETDWQTQDPDHIIE